VWRCLGRGRFAWVVGNAADFGKIHRWCAIWRLMSHIERNIFREFGPALAWLEVTPSEACAAFIAETGASGNADELATGIRGRELRNSRARTKA
jgi:hypothetical protein